MPDTTRRESGRRPVCGLSVTRGRSMMPSDLEAAFLHYWRALAPGAPEPVAEYRFAAESVGLGPGIRERLADAGLRDWRFDFAWPRRRVAVELEGGTWTGGRHVRGDGFARDCEKYNLAALHGWRVIRLTAGMLEDDPVRWIGQVREAVEDG